MSRPLQLINIDGYMIGSNWFPVQQLVQDAKDWKRSTRTPIMGRSYLDAPDSLIFRVLAFQSIPFRVEASFPNETLMVQIFRFPYSINGVHEYQELGCRICPQRGRIDSFVLQPEATILVTALDFRTQYSSYVLGSLKLEIYHNSHQFEIMPPMQSREGFQSERYSSEMTDM